MVTELNRSGLDHWCARAQIHTPGSLLDGWDVDAAFDSFRVDHPDRWDGEGLSAVSGREDGGYPPFEDILHGYRDRMTDILRARLVNGEAEIGTDGLVEPVETYLHTYGSARTRSPSPGLILTLSSQLSPVFPNMYFIPTPIKPAALLACRNSLARTLAH